LDGAVVEGWAGPLGACARLGKTGDGVEGLAAGAFDRKSSAGAFAGSCCAGTSTGLLGGKAGVVEALGGEVVGANGL
jgi:hypothetical protein